MTNIIKKEVMETSNIDMLNEAKGLIASEEQLVIETNHILHGGMYSRTITMVAGEALAGAKLNVPTLVIVSGNINVLVGRQAVNITGSRIIPASKDREQLFYAIEDSSITMIMATDLLSIEEIEDSFTDSSNLLMSRNSNAINNIIITGE